VIVAVLPDPAIKSDEKVTVQPGSDSAQLKFTVKAHAAKGKSTITVTANGSSASDDFEVV
jgi:hypothetical protein